MAEASDACGADQACQDQGMALLNQRLSVLPLLWLSPFALALAAPLQASGLGEAIAPPAGTAGPAVTPPAPSLPAKIPPALMPVPSLDLNRYVGGWYEIARIPNRFQRQCARHSVALYGLLPDERLSVLNQCIKRNGNVDQATGVARVIDPLSRARLKVSLVSVLGWRPFWGDYWVIGLDEAYRWAVVGSPDRRYGWVLARTPRLDEASMATIREILERQGYAWSRFEPSHPTLTQEKPAF
jgi:apolipoprotein D and lipocalin family protein